MANTKNGESSSSSSSDESANGVANNTVVNLYSLLKLDQDATPDEVHRAYRLLSTTFHPDKIPASTSSPSPSSPDNNDVAGTTTNNNTNRGREEEIQQIFLDIKRAHEILIDPVLRLTYDHFGEEGVTLLRKVQQQQREQKTRRDAAVQRRREEMDEDSDDNDDDDIKDDEEDEYILYDRIEGLLQSNHPIQALEELCRFMEQHDYHQNLSEDNQVQLNLSLEFPPVVDLTTVFTNGREYLQFVQKSMAANPPRSKEEREYYQSRFNQEVKLVEYQLGKIREAQKASVGFTLTSIQPRNAGGGGDGPPMRAGGSTSIQPKWSMAMGANTSLIYPDVGTIPARLAGQKEEELHHPISMFVNTAYQANPHTQINLTANLSNDESHQFVLGSAHTFTNLTAVRYNMTFLSKSPLKTPLVIDLKSYRHLKGIGMATGGISMGADGRMLQWNAQWEALVREVHRCSVKASMGLLQGNSIELSYRARVQKSPQNRIMTWLDEHIHLPKKVELSTLFGRVTKVTAMVTHEFTTLAMHPTIGFGMEHNISLGRWLWIWEFDYHNSTFRIPIPVMQLGSIADPGVFYARQLYYATYCLLLQSIVADLLHDHDEQSSNSGIGTVNKKSTTEKARRNRRTIAGEGMSKFRVEAERQLALMDVIAEKKRFLESQRKNGLVILQATYWYQPPVLPMQDSNDDGDPAGNDEVVNGSKNGIIIAMDATKQIQFWVSDGTLSIPSELPKSSWMGFYDLRTETSSYGATPSSPSWSRPTKWDWNKLWRRLVRSVNVSESGRRKKEQQQQQQTAQHKEPQLTVRYSHLGSVYEVTVGEREALVLPGNPKVHRLGDANFVQ
jgi:curved DNA-binding protein CbpA